MKQLTLTSDFFKNECSESFLKAIQGNESSTHNEQRFFIGYRGSTFAIAVNEQKTRFKKENEKNEAYSVFEERFDYCYKLKFNLDDSFKVDWACLSAYMYSYWDGMHYIKLDYLTTLEGVTIEEVG